MNQVIINQTLRAHIAMFASSNGIKVAWPNLEFNEINSVYLRFFVMPASTQNIGLSHDMPIFRGVLQVNVIGNANSGESNLLAIAERLLDHLPNGYTFENDIYLSDEPNIHASIQDGVNYTIPVSVPYRCDAVR